jgi:uncharacterized protein YmfQ (DUF2313 family)
MTVFEKIYQLTVRLFPRGRFFRTVLGSIRSKLYGGLAKSEERAFNDSTSTMFSILPDNANFTELDATQWEVRLGLISNPSVPLADRKLAILRKMNHPGTIPARQSADYMEQQLREAGFDVYVYRNDSLVTPADVVGPENTGIAEHSPNVEHMETGSEHGSTETGSLYFDMIVNTIDADVDQFFNVGNSLRSSFYIGGSPFGTYSNVPQNRELEFRQLVLKIKPTQTVGFLLINYV